MMRKLRALNGAMENCGPFDDTLGILETLNKAMGKLGELNDLIGKTGNWAHDSAIEYLGLFDDAMGKLEIQTIEKLAPW